MNIFGGIVFNRHLISMKKKMIKRKQIDEYMVFVITKYQNKTIYYLYELDTDKNQYKWTKHIKNSMLFHTFDGARNFINAYFSTNTFNDITIKKVKDPDY